MIMIGNRYSGDNIAAEFLRLVKNSASRGSPETQAHKTASLEDSSDNILNASAGDFILQNDLSEDSKNVSDLESKVEDFKGDESEILDGESNLSNDVVANAISGNGNIVKNKIIAEKRLSITANKKTLNILKGLGKIAKSLRGKHEEFAADVVESTALSIRRDAMANDHKKAVVASELQKISNDLANENKFFASDLVSTTIDKILKS
jgi:hypothetical protein